MSIFIDSAVVDEIKQAFELGFVKGVTTNPLLMAKVKGSWRGVLKEICRLVAGPVYYQIDSVEKLTETAKSIYDVSPGQIILKVPATGAYFKLVAEIGHEIPCCVTAVYSEAQLLAANEAGAKSVAVYVNRISRFFKEGQLTSDGINVLSSMRNLIDKQDMPINILAASLKSPGELVSALNAGAHNVTTTLDVLKQLACHPLSEKAEGEFNQAYTL